MTTVHLRITGKVQGVWFRASTKDKALSLGLKGKVWNEKNGDVGVIAQGTEDQIDLLIHWCQEGPPLARVEAVDVEYLESSEVFQSFDISRPQ